MATEALMNGQRSPRELSAVLQAAAQDDDPNRERSDVADFIKHVQKRAPNSPQNGHGEVGGSSGSRTADRQQQQQQQQQKRTSSSELADSSKNDSTAAAAADLALAVEGETTTGSTDPSTAPSDSPGNANNQFVNNQIAQSKRASSWCDAEHRRNGNPEVGEMARQICAPGGFRREHLHARASADGVPEEERPVVWSRSFMESFANSMVVYDQAYGLPQVDDDGRPLLGRRSVAGLGNIAVAASIFKANMGTNVLYMPHSFEEGGWLVGMIFMAGLCFLSVICVARLIEAKDGSQESFGDIMERAAGKPGRTATNICIVLLQTGTCCCYLVNVANMLEESLGHFIDSRILILIEGLLVSPLVLIRKVSKLSPVNIFGGVLTMLGIAFTFAALGVRWGQDGTSDVEAVRPKGLLVCLGIACFTFEGIGLAIPVYESARDPLKFVPVYGATIFFMMSLIAVMSFLGYFCFGEDTNTLILINLGKGWVSDCIRIMFSLVMMVSFPLQMLPAIRIVESIFLMPSRPQTCDKHLKSAFRVLFVLLVAGVAIGASTALDNFVSLIGAVCGLPLAFIFPAICHGKLVATRGSLLAITDILFVAFGACVTVAVGLENILTWGKKA
mmetsp:Transcript_72726/g.151845  ORF Transcript_72726/g.151845 Transcript_72726/m.151845 type:complete len:617 (-) Transcript_72726:142-1992(-)|eukprot:CAMPEP_0206443682 /NCGR_PEP_ID=MMETSP0324_2-20121206/14499_1 /ASSEMBLY_ACC=CAM_ASM_000836 /TAXON_ID=2866 /ORGANISM="Crypthecodinium cohnii, Strain Seligo" /LENGTH=616 /DNA_ID=CAMNT_0053911635 /DNA_START=60 /DNA_END=1910 /DNA_ORIENTATION=-